MAATLCRLGVRDAAVFVCLKHSQALLFTATQRQQQQQQRQQLQQQQQRCLASRQSSSSSPPPSSSSGPLIRTTNIEGFELSSLGPPGNPHPRPVVVLIGWLNAKRKHLQKYQEVYWSKGFDVLTMPVSPIHIIRPKMGIKYTNRLLNVLQGNKDLCGRQVVFHGFSIGAFIYTQLQLMLQRDPGSSSSSHHLLNDRVSGLVLDSPAYIDHMCRGIANSVTTNSLGRAVINNTLLMYLAAFPKSVTFHYNESHRMFHENDVPTLILYSPVDLISSAETSERYVEEWKEKGFPVFTCKFPNSSHVSHFRLYQEEYLSALNAFIDQLDLHKSGAKILEVEDGAATAVVEEAAAAGTVVQPLEQVQAKVP